MLMIQISAGAILALGLVLSAALMSVDENTRAGMSAWITRWFPGRQNRGEIQEEAQNQDFEEPGDIEEMWDHRGDTGQAWHYELNCNDEDMEEEQVFIIRNRSNPTAARFSETSAQKKVKGNRMN